jgi:UvrB/uvrC motif
MILITGAGLIHEDVDNEGNVKRRDISEEPLALHLDDIVLVEDEATVLDLMLALAHHEDEINLDFASALQGCMFAGFMEEAMLDTDIGKHFKYAEITHAAKIVDGVWTEATDFYAVGRSVDEDDDSGEMKAFTIEYAAVSTYKNLPIVLNNEFNITNTDGSILATAFREFSLYEVVATILSEMSLYGYAPQRMDAFRKFAGIALLPAKEKEQSLEELEAELAEALSAENYEKATELRDRIKKQKGIK